MTQSEALAAFALDLQYDSVPPDIVNLAKGHLLDVLGIALASSRFDFGESILKGARELGGGGNVRALGSGVRLPAASAALVNGTLGHGLDYDDTHIAAVYHASAPAFAAALSVAEARGSDGRSLLLEAHSGPEQYGKDPVGKIHLEYLWERQIWKDACANDQSGKGHGRSFTPPPGAPIVRRH